MSLEKEKLIQDLEGLLNVLSDDDKWKTFLYIIKEHGLCDETLKSIKNFDDIHNRLLDAILPQDSDGCPTLDLSKFTQFEKLLSDLRILVENLVISNCLITQKLDVYHTETLDLKLQLGDLQETVYNSKFIKISSAISTPLKNELKKKFTKKRIRFDPLDDDLLYMLVHKYYNNSFISESTYNEIVEIYKEIAEMMTVTNYEDLIKIMLCRAQRNINEHEKIDKFFNRCAKFNIKPTFMNFLTDVGCNNIEKYKKDQLETLEKIFNYYYKKRNIFFVRINFISKKK